MAPTTLTPVESEADFQTQVKSLSGDALLVVYFHAPWAAPCAQMSTVLETLAGTYPATDPPTIRFLSINAEELPDLSEEYDVTAVPYIVLQEAGHTLEKISGNDAARVRDAVEKHASRAGAPGGTQLPPAQQVTRPAQQPAPAAPATNGTAAAVTSATATSTTTPAKNLSSYAPEAPPEPMSEEDLHARLSSLVKAAPAMLFMKGTPSAPQCGFSRQLVSILRENSVRYGFFNILADEEVRQGMKKFADWPTFPQLWLGGELVGGLDIVKEELENDPSFLTEYSVEQDKKGAGGAVAPEAPTATA